MDNIRGHLTEEDINNIKNLKGKVSANQIRKRYKIGYHKLKKIWEDVKPYNVDDILLNNDIKANNDDNNNIKTYKLNDILPNNNDFKDDIKTIIEQNNKQTELLLRLVKEQEEEDIEEEEEEQTLTIQDISNNIKDYIGYSKTVVYCIITGIAVWQLVSKTCKQVELKPPQPTRPNLFKKEPDPFVL